LAWEKTGQFMVRTHVRKYQQILKKLRTMSGGLELGPIIGDLAEFRFEIIHALDFLFIGY
jgi:hypothetical protein